MSTTVPQIAVTQEEEENDNDFDNGTNYLSLAEALTDMEDLYEDDEDVAVKIQKPARKSKLKIKLTHEEALTDLEDFEASSDEDDNKILIKHSKPISLEDLDLEGGVFEESYKTHMATRKGTRKFKTQCSTTQRNVEDANYEIFDNYTDEELFDTENEELAETIPENTLDLDTYNLENLNVADSSNKDDTKMLSLSPNHLDSSGSKFPIQNNFLNTLSVSPNLTDLTDVEVLPSDSDDDKVVKKMKHRRRKQKSSRRQSLTDVEDLHVSDNDDRFKSYTNNPKRKNKKNWIIKKSYSIAYDSDNEDNANLPFPICKKIAAKKQNILNIPEFDTNFLTDTEDFEDVTECVVTPADENHEEAFEKTLEAMAECYSKINESHTSIKTQNIRSSLRNYIASEEANTTDSDHYESENLDSEKNEESACYDIKFVGAAPTIRKKKQINTLVVPIQAEEPVTDCENVNSSDEEMSKMIPIALARQLRMLTDEEEFLDDSDEIDSIPEINLPPPVRNLVILKDNGSLPTVQIVPMEDTSVKSPQEPFSLAETDEESVSEAEEAVEITKSISVTDFSLPDCGMVKETENKQNKSKKLLVALKDEEDLTDTEDLVLNTPKKRRAPKFKHLHERFLAQNNNSLRVKTPEPRGFTDTEDIYLSDGNSEFLSLSPLLNVSNLPAPEGFTDVEVVGDSSDDEPYFRTLSCTPQQLRELGGEMLIFKEGSGPFSVQEHLDINKAIELAPNFIVSPVNTDTEDVHSSADETATYSRAETASPNQLHFELKQTDTKIVDESKLKLASEGCMYLKGGGYIDPISDIEYMSAEELNFNNVPEPLKKFNDDNVSFNFRSGSVSCRLQEGWETARQPLNLESTAPSLIKDAAQQDIPLPGTQFVTYESVLLPNSSMSSVPLDPPLLHRTTSYTQIDAMLENMLFEVQKQEKLFGLDLDVLEPEQQCLNTLELLPSTDAIIEVPIKKMVRKPKIYETTQEIIVNQDESPYDLISFTGNPKDELVHDYDDVVFQEKTTVLEEISKNIDKLVTSVEEEEHRLLTNHPEDEYLEKPYTYKIDFQRANTASSESLSDHCQDNVNDSNEQKESSADEDYEYIENTPPIHSVHLRDSRTGDDIWWEGIYRNLSIVPEEDEENQSLLGSYYSNKSYSTKAYSPLIETIVFERSPSLNSGHKQASIDVNESSDESSSVVSSSSEEGTHEVTNKAVKAEVKLLVKTLDRGKEAIEIRSVREFLDYPVQKTNNQKPMGSSKVFKDKSQTLPSKLSDKFSYLTQKFSGLIDKKKSSSYSPIMDTYKEANKEELSKKPSYILPHLFVRSTDQDKQSNLLASKEMSRSKTELLAASNKRFPLDYDPNTCVVIQDSPKLDLFANIPFYPCYEQFSNKPKSETPRSIEFISNPFIETSNIPEAYCDWLHAKEDDHIGTDGATSSTSTRDTAASSTSRTEGEEGAEKDETEYERRVGDQHQLSEEMKQLLKELEKETKQ